MHFEGSLTTEEEALRAPLYDALYASDEEELLRILEDEDTVLDVMALPEDGELPWAGRARRILRTDSPLLRSGTAAMPDGEEVWEEFVQSLSNLLDEEDETGLYAYSLCEAWKDLNRAYRLSLGEEGLGQGDTRVGLKITPYSS